MVTILEIVGIQGWSKLKVMSSSRDGDNHGDRDYYINGNSYGMATVLGLLTILRMVTVQGAATVPRIVGVIAMAGAVDWTSYI